jgi:hypothetical protein
MSNIRTTAIKLIIKSVASKYTDEIECSEPGHGVLSYSPVNAEHIRGLLEPWRGVLTPEALEEVFEQIMEGTDSADDWPDAWCEDDADHYWQQLNGADHDLEIVADRKRVIDTEIAAQTALKAAPDGAKMTGLKEARTRLDIEEKQLRAEFNKWSALWDCTSAAEEMRSRIDAS